MYSLFICCNYWKLITKNVSNSKHRLLYEYASIRILKRVTAVKVHVTEIVLSSLKYIVVKKHF